MNTEKRSKPATHCQHSALCLRYGNGGKWAIADTATLMIALALSACCVAVCQADQTSNRSRIGVATLVAQASSPSNADQGREKTQHQSPAFPLPKLQSMLDAAATSVSIPVNPRIRRLADIADASANAKAAIPELDLESEHRNYADSKVMRAVAENNVAFSHPLVSTTSGKLPEESPSDLPASADDQHPLVASQLAAELKTFSAAMVSKSQLDSESSSTPNVSKDDITKVAEFNQPPRIAAPIPELTRAELSTAKLPTAEPSANDVSTVEVSVEMSPVEASAAEVSADDVAPMHTTVYEDAGTFATSFRCGVMCTGCDQCRQGRTNWRDTTTIPWEVFAQGEYVGPHRAPHVVEYRLRVDDRIDFMFRLTAEASEKQYEFNVGDQLRIESLTQPELDREVTIQPDGYITVRLLGQVRAAGKSVDAVTEDLEQQYRELVKEPAITITPLIMNSRLTELRNTVDSRFGAGGQTISARVTPEGTVQLPGIGSVLVQGLTLSEAGQEVNARYRRLVKGGLDITPVLAARAPRFAFVLGEVGRPGRIELEGPTTVIQAIAMAGSWTTGADLHHVIVLRRDSNWELMATQMDLRKPLYAREPCPDDLWLRDSDIVLLPKNKLQITNEIIDKVFTRGVYSVFPTSFPYQLRQLTTIR